MKKYFMIPVLLFFTFTGFYNISAQDFGKKLYWIEFKDKGLSHEILKFNPYIFFDTDAIERKKCMAFDSRIPFDSTDYPVSGYYIEEIKICIDSEDEYIGESRWMNGIGIYLADHHAEEVKKFPFVKNVICKSFTKLNGNNYLSNITVDTVKKSSSCSAIYAKLGEEKWSAKDKIPKLTEQEIELLKYQTDRLGAEYFKKNNLNGKGVKIAVIDVGFSKANSQKELAHLFQNGQIKECFDFVKNKPLTFTEPGDHGTAVLSCIAGILKYSSTNSSSEEIISGEMGLAPGAEFYLARTERVKSEFFAEEIRWGRAAEWAEQKGVKIINSSLGYTKQRYMYYHMDGKTTFITKAAQIASQKGILVINAAGNEGDDEFRFINAPADAEGVLSIGGTNPYTDYHIDFSSYGPTFDGRRKPNLSAPGHVYVIVKNGLSVNYGTSFSSPLVAGFAACIAQKNPEWTSKQLFDILEKSGHLYPYYDYAHGYGIPQASKIFENISPKVTFKFSLEGNRIMVNLDKTPSSAKIQNLYYAIHTADGKITRYAVIKVESRFALAIDKDYLKLHPGGFLVVHFEGYTDILREKELSE